MFLCARNKMSDVSLYPSFKRADIIVRLEWHGAKKSTTNYCCIILVWPTSWTTAVGGLIVCVLVCVSADMSPYCSAHDEWLIMKLCMYFGYHDANNVSNFGGDPVTQFNLTRDVLRLVLPFDGIVEKHIHKRLI